jgi:uncharacterized membrane protein
VEVDGQVLCPGCFERLSSEGSLPSVAKEVRNYRGLSAACILGALFFLFLAAPAGIVGIQYAFRGIMENRRRKEAEGNIMLYVLAVLNLAVCVGGTLFLLSLFKVI